MPIYSTDYTPTTLTATNYEPDDADGDTFIFENSDTFLFEDGNTFVFE